MIQLAATSFSNSHVVGTVRFPLPSTPAGGKTRTDRFGMCRKIVLQSLSRESIMHTLKALIGRLPRYRRIDLSPQVCNFPHYILSLELKDANG